MARRLPEGGYTLIEILMVMLIIGLLASIALPEYLGVRNASYDAATVSHLRTALDVARQDEVSNNGVFPTATQVISDINTTQPELKTNSAAQSGAAPVSPGYTLVMDNYALYQQPVQVGPVGNNLVMEEASNSGKICSSGFINDQTAGPSCFTPTQNGYYYTPTQSTWASSTPIALGNTTFFPLPSFDSGFAPGQLISDRANGLLWFVESTTSPSKIESFNPVTDAVSSYNIAGYNDLYGIAAGPDGNLWFTGALNEKVGEFSPTTGQVSSYSVPATVGAFRPGKIVAGLDGNLWFDSDSSEVESSVIAKVTTAGVVTLIDLGSDSGNAWVSDIEAGSDGNVWATVDGYTGLPYTSALYKITPSGVATQMFTINGGDLDAASSDSTNDMFVIATSTRYWAANASTTDTIYDIADGTGTANGTYAVHPPDGSHLWPPFSSGYNFGYAWFTSGDTSGGYNRMVTASTNGVAYQFWPYLSNSDGSLTEPVGAAGADGVDQNEWFGTYGGLIRVGAL